MKVREMRSMELSTYLVRPIKSALGRGTGRGFVIAGVGIILFVTVMTIIAPFISPHDPTQLGVGPPNSPPSGQFPLGTDQYGRDMLSRILWGGRFILLVAVAAVAICMSVGVPVGLLSAYAGGFVDKAVSLLMDSMYAFPSLVLAIMIVSIFGVSIINDALAIAVVYVPSYFRVVRSQVLTIKELPYVEAAKSIGASRLPILLRYIWPNVISSVVVIATINFADSILTTAGLDFIGLGLPVTLPDWGIDLTYGRQVLASGYWWVIVFSGLMIVISALGFALVSEGLAERTNPKLR
jgi:peptide/nickel transport system permease protein